MYLYSSTRVAGTRRRCRSAGAGVYQVEHAELSEAAERGRDVLEQVLAQVQEREPTQRADRVRHARQPVAAQVQVLEPAAQHFVLYSPIQLTQHKKLGRKLQQTLH